MNREEFIQTNIKKILLSEGLPTASAEVGADSALDLYFRKDEFPKGKAFDFCLRHARIEAKRHQSAQRVR